jgi:hypothetical protein
MPYLLYAEPVCTCLRRNQYHPELPVDKWEDMMPDVARQETISSSNSLLGFGPQQKKTLTSRSSFDRGRLPCYPILLEICHLLEVPYQKNCMYPLTGLCTRIHD